jgi:adenylate cyclase
MIVAGLEHCTERAVQEKELAKRLRFGPEIRLACQTSITGDVTIRRLILDAEDLEIAQRLTSATIPVSVGEEKKLAILFADIRGFSRFAERLPPYDVIHVLNRYFYDMSQVIGGHGGCIHNCMGDGLMALFGLQDDREPAFRAVGAGLDMLGAVAKLKPYLQNVYQMSFEIGIGVHFGDVVVGCLGGEEIRRVTAIGDAVNLASRIEVANKECATRLLVSEATYFEVQPFVQVGRQFQRSLKGKRGKYRLYEIIGLRHIGVNP